MAIPASRNVMQKEAEKKFKYVSLGIEIKRMWNLKCSITPVITGTTGIVTRSLRKNFEDIPGKHSLDSLQKTAMLGTSHIIRKLLQCETWSLSGGGHRWFKRSTRKKRPLTQDDDDDDDDDNVHICRCGNYAVTPTPTTSVEHLKVVPHPTELTKTGRRYKCHSEGRRRWYAARTLRNAYDRLRRLGLWRHR